MHVSEGMFICGTLGASTYAFALSAYERYVKVKTPLRALQSRTVTQLYAACWAVGIGAANLNFGVGGYR